MPAGPRADEQGRRVSRAYRPRSTRDRSRRGAVRREAHLRRSCEQSVTRLRNAPPVSHHPGPGSGQGGAWRAGRRSRRCPGRAAACRGPAQSASPAEPGGAERVGDVRRGVPHQQRALQHQRHRLDQPPGRALVGRRRGPCRAGRPPRPAARSAPRASATSASSASTAAGSRASARSTSSALTLPEPSQIEFSGASRYSRGSPLSSTYPLPPRHSSASPTTAGARLHTQYLPTATASRRSSRSPLSNACGQPQRQRRRRLGLDRQVGQHVAHQRLVGEQAAERAAVRGVVGRLRHAPARISAVDPSTQSSRVAATISMMVRDAAALLAEPPRPGAVELDLGRRVRPVAQLVLEPLEPERVARAVRQHPRHQEAGQPAGRLRQHQEQVAHRRRAEPLVPGQQVLAVGRQRLGPGRVGPDVGAALLLGHPHAGEQPGLAGGRAAAPGRRWWPSSRGSHTAASSGSVRSAGTAAYVIETGQPCPASTCDQTRKPAARAHVRRRSPAGPGAPRAARRRPRRPSARARPGGSRPRRPGARTGRGCAAPAGSRSPRRPSAAPPRCRPGEPSAERPRQVRPARRTARRPRPARGRSPNTSWPTSGGGWFVTSWVGPVTWPTVEAWPRGPSASSGPVPNSGPVGWSRASRRCCGG